MAGTPDFPDRPLETCDKLVRLSRALVRDSKTLCAGTRECLRDLHARIAATKAAVHQSDALLNRLGSFHDLQNPDSCPPTRGSSAVEIPTKTTRNSSSHSPKHVLLVEDTPSDQWLIDRAIKASAPGLLLTLLHNGEDAIACLAGVPPFDDLSHYPRPALVLLDLRLPRRSGLEVLAWLRSAPAPLDVIPVIVLSSSDWADDVRRAYACGANGYITKPPAADDFKSLLGRVLAYWVDANIAPISSAT